MFRFIKYPMFLFYSIVFTACAEELPITGLDFGAREESFVARDQARISWFEKMGSWISSLSRPKAASAAKKPDLPESQMLQEMVDYALVSLTRYLQDPDTDCWTLTDWDQFHLTYTTLDRITARFEEYDGSLRRYFRILQFEVKKMTSQSPNEFIKRESKRVKNLNRKLKCGR